MEFAALAASTVGPVNNKVVSKLRIKFKHRIFQHRFFPNNLFLVEFFPEHTEDDLAEGKRSSGCN